MTRRIRVDGLALVAGVLIAVDVAMPAAAAQPDITFPEDTTASAPLLRATESEGPKDTTLLVEDVLRPFLAKGWEVVANPGREKRVGDEVSRLVVYTLRCGTEEFLIYAVRYTKAEKPPVVVLEHIDIGTDWYSYDAAWTYLSRSMRQERSECAGSERSPATGEPLPSIVTTPPPEKGGKAAPPPIVRSPPPPGDVGGQFVGEQPDIFELMEFVKGAVKPDEEVLGLLFDDVLEPILPELEPVLLCMAQGIKTQPEFGSRAEFDQHRAALRIRCDARVAHERVADVIGAHVPAASAEDRAAWSAWLLSETLLWAALSQ